MTNEQRRAIRDARRTLRASYQHDTSQYHYDIDAGMMVFADLHAARSMRERAVRS